jgi:hypothetical protein
MWQQHLLRQRRRRRRTPWREFACAKLHKSVSARHGLRAFDIPQVDEALPSSQIDFGVCVRSQRACPDSDRVDVTGTQQVYCGRVPDRTDQLLLARRRNLRCTNGVSLHEGMDTETRQWSSTAIEKTCSVAPDRLSGCQRSRRLPAIGSDGFIPLPIGTDEALAGPVGRSGRQPE